jgi:cytochrome bd-type quinol oxidase subunit 2
MMWLGLTAYALLGGADFGGGFWDLVAGGAKRGAPQRALIEHSIGPVWEANHVWLIFVLVILVVLIYLGTTRDQPLFLPPVRGGADVPTG